MQDAANGCDCPQYRNAGKDERVEAAREDEATEKEPGGGALRVLGQGTERQEGKRVEHLVARTGLEDNVRLDRATLAPSNAALVRRVVEICERHERPVATWQQARERLGLRMPAAY